MSTELHSQALFALRMQALIMFDVPFLITLFAGALFESKA